MFYALCVVSTHTPSFKMVSSFSSATLCPCPFPYYKHFIIQAPATFSLFSFLTPSLFILTLQVPHPIHPGTQINTPPSSYSFLLFPRTHPLQIPSPLFFSSGSCCSPHSSSTPSFLPLSPYLIPLAFLNLFRSSFFLPFLFSTLLLVQPSTSPSSSFNYSLSEPLKQPTH